MEKWRRDVWPYAASMPEFTARGQRRLKPPLEIISGATAESAPIHITSSDLQSERCLGAGIHRPKPTPVETAAGDRFEIDGRI
jgi:hypothetical protein